MSTTQTILAVYENGILRPLQPLCLKEKSQVSVTVTDSSSTVDEFARMLGGRPEGERPVPTLEEVRKITAKIPVSLSELIRQERDNSR